MCEDCKHEHGAGTSCGSCGCGAGGACKTCAPTDKNHWRRRCMHLCVKLLWLLGIIALVSAWVADSRGTRVFGFSADHLFHDATALLVLAALLKLKKRGGHGCK